MPNYHELRLDRPGLETIRFLICRDTLSTNGDLETAFLEDVAELQCHPSGSALSSVLAQAAGRAGTDIVVCIRNPALVLDQDLPNRVSNACRTLPAPNDWAVAGSGGLGLSEERHLALYASANPGLPSVGGPKPVRDLMPDLTLFNAPFTARVLARRSGSVDAALEPLMISEGYLDGRVSMFLPGLNAGIEGDLLGRDLNRLTTELSRHFAQDLSGQQIHTLTGPIDLPDTSDIHGGVAGPCAADLAMATSTVIAEHCDTPSISIVTRTQFARPELIRRLLTSISRARQDLVPLEIILASDADPDLCDAQLAALSSSFPSLHIKLVRSEPHGHSRVSNLIAGIQAATHDYLAVIDDDDYVDLLGFSQLQKAFFRGSRPLVVTRCDAHEERWEISPGRSPVLASSTLALSYPPHRWRQMFDGVNKLPICAVLAPTTFVQNRIESWQFTHDLSEDYALFLLLLTASDLPEIFEIPEVFCHISLRGTEQSVGMTDRRPWVRDISGHLSAIMQPPSAVAGPGQWQVHTSRAHAGPDPTTSRGLADLRAALDQSERERRLLQRERARLIAELEAVREASA